MTDPELALGSKNDVLEDNNVRSNRGMTTMSYVFQTWDGTAACKIRGIPAFYVTDSTRQRASPGCRAASGGPVRRGLTRSAAGGSRARPQGRRGSGRSTGSRDGEGPVHADAATAVRSRRPMTSTPLPRGSSGVERGRRNRTRTCDPRGVNTVL